MSTPTYTTTETMVIAALAAAIALLVRSCRDDQRYDHRMTVAAVVREQRVGYVTCFGIINGVDTSSMTNGQEVIIRGWEVK